MKKIGWYIILLLMMLGYHVHVDAQHISVSAPSHVAAGENFRVAYTINTSDVEEFRMGGVQDGLEVIAGPYTSSQSSYQMINGHTSSSSSVTITYTLYAAKNGSFTIGASHALVGGKRLSSGLCSTSSFPPLFAPDRGPEPSRALRPSNHPLTWIPRLNPVLEGLSVL